MTGKEIAKVYEKTVQLDKGYPIDMKTFGTGMNRIHADKKVFDFIRVHPINLRSQKKRFCPGENIEDKSGKPVVSPENFKRLPGKGMKKLVK